MARFADRDFHDHAEEEAETIRTAKFLMKLFGLGLVTCSGLVFALLHNWR